jgi:predicted DNA-binding transcriptional regulator YafY
MYELLTILQSRRYAVTSAELAEELECSIATVKRYISKLRNYYEAPIRYDSELRGYVLDKTDDDAIQFPGLWFNVAELHSLLTIYELIDKLDPGLLREKLLPLRNRVEKELALRGIDTGELSRRFLFLGMGIRICCPLTFKLTASATMERKRLKLRYHSRGRDKQSTRHVSPQQLIYYRGNWYLAAYCHTRRALRTLSLDRMTDVELLKTECKEIDEAALRDHYTTSFGIFAGQPQQEAVLIFSRESARWVAEERRHPNQQGHLLEDGSFELRLPYADERELIMEILRHGPEVRVIAPPELKQAVQERLRRALELYTE